MKSDSKFKQIFLRIWRDPVWSKVISAVILIAIPVLWAKFTAHSWSDIYQFIIAAISFRLPVYFFLSVIAFNFIVKKCIQLFQRRNDPPWDEQIGNYTFKDLYNILLTQKLAVATRGMAWGGRAAPEENLLVLLQTYQIFLNRGIGITDQIDDGGYLYGIFAPRMVGYGLVEIYQKPDDHLPEVTDIAYKTSELGHKFHACLDKVILAQDIEQLKREKNKR